MAPIMVYTVLCTDWGMVKRSTSLSSSRSLPSAPPTAKPSKGRLLRYSALAWRRELRARQPEKY